MTRDAFSSYHPIINFTFFIGAFLFGMLLMHPAYLLCSLFFSGTYYLTVHKRIKPILRLIPLLFLFALLNALFNPLGDTVLFTYFDGRHFTWEALCYGMVLAALFLSVIGWFAGYNAVMTSDKFLYLFGRTLPSLSLILTMVLRLVPMYQKKIHQIAGARKCIGKSGMDGKPRKNIENSMAILSALTSWALEGGIITADSMRSRGFGTARRTSFSRYRWERRDTWVLLGMALCMTGVVLCVAAGGAKAEFIPMLAISCSAYTKMGLVFYAMFLAIPTAMNIWEEVLWHILRSKI